jgi:hypothetical protein
MRPANTRVTAGRNLPRAQLLNLSALWVSH